MMKSFFKKLSLTMALAMVVTTAAPAAQASAAEASLGIALQNAASKEEVKSTFSVGVDATVDLKYYGAPKNYKELNPTWTSSDESIAKVDKYGVVTGVAEGVATITIALNNGVKGTAKVVVAADTVTALTIALQEAASKDEAITEAAVEVDGTVDLKYYGAPKYYKQLNPQWVSSNTDVATVDKNGVVTGVADGVATIVIKLDNGQFGAISVTVGKGEVKAEEMKAWQVTHTAAKVTFTEDHNFDKTGVEFVDGTENGNTVKLYRVFSTEEMSKMVSTNGFAFDEDGNGYQAYYLKEVTYNETDDLWNLVGYPETSFVDGATYAVVYGPNATSSTVLGDKVFFTAHIGKVTKIDVYAKNVATVENEVEPGISAKLETKLYNDYDIDLTVYYGTADETYYELVDDNGLNVSVSGDEVIFDEAGSVIVEGVYTYYDEELEKDVVLSDKAVVEGSNYRTYDIEKIYKWTVTEVDDATGDAKAPDWAKLNDKIIAGDDGQIYVIVVDNRGNYFTNHEGTKKVDNHDVGFIGGEEDTPFEQYGYELVFDSLDPDSLLVDVEGAVETYKKTQSFAVVSYKRTDLNDNVKVNEIGIMGIDVTAPRELDHVKYDNGTSFTILKETEAEDGTPNKYGTDKTFGTTAELKATFMTQYPDVKWDGKAEDYDPSITNFTVTTSKEAFKDVAERMADALNEGVVFDISYNNVFAETEDAKGKPDATSVTFKVKEEATGDSTTVTIKLDMPKYEDDGVTVFVDDTRAKLNGADLEMYIDTTSTAKLFQVSKANQEVGYFRTGELEMDDEEGKCYYVANDLTSNFVVKNGDNFDFVSVASGTSMATTTALKEGDYVLVVTDPSGKVFPAVGMGGNGKTFKTGSQLGIKANADGTAYELVLAAAAVNEDGIMEMEYAPNGTYRASVYKISKKVVGESVTKYNVKTVSSTTFKVSNTQKDVWFYHQEATKSVENVAFDHTASKAANLADVIEAIDATMTFRLNGKDLDLNAAGEGTYTSWLKKNNADVPCDVKIVDVDFKIQDDDKRVVVNTVTFAIETPAVEGGYYLSKVKVNRSINAAD